MTRRSFITAMLGVAVAATLPNIDLGKYPEIRPEMLDDLDAEATSEDIAYYYMHSFNLYVDNPRRCAVITNIVGE